MLHPSIPLTKEHMKKVQELLSYVSLKLRIRGSNHDSSKLKEPELSIFDKAIDLRNLKYGSKEYNKALQLLKPALKHHYSVNDHHPEHYGKEGLSGFSLLALMELLADWKASTYRTSEGNIIESIEINQERFKYSDEVKQILLNTVKELHWES